MKKSLLAAVTMVLSVILGPVASATVIAINNGGFESPDSSSWTVGDITGWSVSGGAAGVFDPAAYSDNVSGASYFAASNATPDGTQTAFSNGGDISQTLVDVLAPGTYTFTLWVGDRYDTALPSHLAMLSAGGFIVGSMVGSPADGNWDQVTASFIVGSGHIGIGSALQIDLINNGGAQINWDGVTLNYEAVPAPAPLALIGFGLLGLALRRRPR